MSNQTGITIHYGSADLEAFARKVGFYAFNRFARRHGLSIDTTLCVIRNVF